jgi:hypothetical protein
MNPPGTQKALNLLAIQMTFLHEVSKEECGEKILMWVKIFW